MTTTQFITQELSRLNSKYPNISITYFVDNFSNSNMIYITDIPDQLEEELIDWECDLEDRFILKYPIDNIEFIDDMSQYNSIQVITSYSSK